MGKSALENTNMLSSLLCAKDFASDFSPTVAGASLISYSDIVRRPEHAQKLLLASAHIAMAYDVLLGKPLAPAFWKIRYRMRKHLSRKTVFSGKLAWKNGRHQPYSGPIYGLVESLTLPAGKILVESPTNWRKVDKNRHDRISALHAFAQANSRGRCTCC